MANDRTFLLRAGFVAFILAGFASSSRASDQRWVLWAGGSWGSPHLISGVDRSWVVAGVDCQHPLLASPQSRLEYVGEWAPVVLIRQPHEQQRTYFGAGAIRDVDQPAKTIWGTAVLPFGVRWTGWPERLVAPFLQGNAGGLYSAQPIPYQVSGASALNFVFKLGGGISIRIPSGQRLMTGYAWWHVSNGSLARVNPGVDANLLYVALAW